MFNCHICNQEIPIGEGSCSRPSCKRASDRREQMYAYLKPPKRVLCQDPEYIKKAIDALQRAGAQRILTVKMQPWPDEYFATIAKHEKHQCDCAEQCKQYVIDRRSDAHNYWHVEKGEPCDCDEPLTEEEWQETVSWYCQKEVADIKRWARQGLKPIQIPVLDEDSVKLYCNYVGRHLKMTDELKNRIEVIEGLVMDAVLAKRIAIDPPDMERLFPGKEETVLWMPSDDGSARRIGVKTPIPKEKTDNKGNFPSRLWTPDEKRAFDAGLGVHQEGYRPPEDRIWDRNESTRSAERLTQTWLKEFLAEKPLGTGGRQQALEDLDRLFRVKLPEESPKKSI